MSTIIPKESIETSVGKFDRFAIQTHFVNVGEDYFDIYEKYVVPCLEENDIVFCSEKIISLCQGRVVRKSDMKLSALAKWLSKFASRPQGGIGVAEPYKMQFAIDTVGAFKVFFAAVAGGIGKLFGKKGIFYTIVGQEVSGLDGFYDKTWAEYGEMGILLPENPDLLCQQIYDKFKARSVIIDANDWGQEILGSCKAIGYTDEQYVEIIKDNPAGQGRECTPFIVARKV